MYVRIGVSVRDDRLVVLMYVVVGVLRCVFVVRAAVDMFNVWGYC